MSRVELLVATMNQTDLSLFEKMNVQTDVIFANQCDKNGFVDAYINGCRVRMISTTTRGVGLNRNLAMLLSEAEICLCSDDDVVYADGYAKIVEDGFDAVPNADIIGFNLADADGVLYDTSSKGGFTHQGFGACRIAYRNAVAKRANVCFTRLFGGGARYSSGEDSLFIKDFVHQGYKVYRNVAVLGHLVNAHESTWFRGYTDKFFFDKGAWCRAAYPNCWRIAKYYLVAKFALISKRSPFKLISLFNKGAKSYAKGLTYDEVYAPSDCVKKG